MSNSNIEVVRKSLGIVSAYRYAVSKGFEGTEDEFAALMASYASVAEDAAGSASSAATSADNAASSAAAAEDAADRAEEAASQAEGAIEVDETLSVKGRAADAKVVGDKIGEVKNDLTIFTGNKVIPVTGVGKYIATSDATVDINATIDNLNYNCSVVEVSAGDVFTINATGGFTPRAWAFVALDGTVLSVAAANAVCNGKVIIAPVNAAYLVINSKNDERTSYCGELLINKISSYGKKVDVVGSLIDFAFAKTPTYSGTNGNISVSANWVTFWFRAADVMYMTKVVTQPAATISINQISFYSGSPSAATYISGISFVTANTINTVDNIVIPAGTEFILVSTRVEAINNIVIEGVNKLAIGETVSKSFDKFRSKIMLIGYSFVNNEYNYAINTAEMYNYIGAHDYDAIKGDVRITSDDALVMCHDAGFTFDGNGKIVSYDSSNNTPIRNLTLEQVEALNFAQTTSAGQIMNVPTFDKYVSICRKYGKTCFITLRDEYIDTILPIVFATIKKYKVEDNTIINSLTYETLQKVREMDGTIPVVFTVNNRSTNIMQADIVNVSKLGNSAYGFYATSAGTINELNNRIASCKTYLDLIKSLGLPIYVAIARQAQLDTIVDNDFDGVQSTDLWA